MRIAAIDQKHEPNSILLVGFLQYRAERRAFEDNQRVSRSQEVFRDLTATRDDLNGADASAQSFIVTGEASSGRR